MAPPTVAPLKELSVVEQRSVRTGRYALWFTFAQITFINDVLPSANKPVGAGRYAQAAEVTPILIHYNGACLLISHQRLPIAGINARCIFTMFTNNRGAAFLIRDNV